MEFYMDVKDIKYVVVIQCHIVKERCSGYYCEYAFSHRNGAFECYSSDSNLRILTMTCGGCCGKAVHRKLTNLLRQMKKKENIKKENIIVHLSSCIAFESYHGNECPHKDYIKSLIGKIGLEIKEGSRISEITEKRREKGIYKKR